jgi:hypothetical protein
LVERIMVAGKPWLRMKVSRNRSAAAFETAYGVLGRNGASSLAAPSQEPRISADEMCT